MSVIPCDLIKLIKSNGSHFNYKVKKMCGKW